MVCWLLSYQILERWTRPPKSYATRNSQFGKIVWLACRKLLETTVTLPFLVVLFILSYSKQRDVKSIPSSCQWYHHHLLVPYFGHNQLSICPTRVYKLYLGSWVGLTFILYRKIWWLFQANGRFLKGLDFSPPWFDSWNRSSIPWSETQIELAILTIFSLVWFKINI
jgi:hypothetical protein